MSMSEKPVMPMSEKPDGQEPPQWCPKCGAPLHKGEALNPEPAPGPPRCDACGQPLAQTPLDSGNFPTNAENAAPRGGGRNPMALVVVAVIAALMLYFGFHMARRSDSNPGF